MRSIAVMNVLRSLCRVKSRHSLFFPLQPSQFPQFRFARLASRFNERSNFESGSPPEVPSFRHELPLWLASNAVRILCPVDVLKFRELQLLIAKSEHISHPDHHRPARVCIGQKCGNLIAAIDRWQLFLIPGLRRKDACIEAGETKPGD